MACERIRQAKTLSMSAPSGTVRSDTRNVRTSINKPLDLFRRTNVRNYVRLLNIQKKIFTERVITCAN